MWCQGTELISSASDGKRTVRVLLFADTLPATMPSDGTDIKGLNGNDVLAEGSFLYVVATGAVYILNSAGEWTVQ